MDKKRAVFNILILAAMSLVVSGCSFGKTSPESGTSMIQSINPKPGATDDFDEKNVELAEDVKRDIRSFDEIYDVAVITGKKNILVAYKVKHLKRFAMKRIEKEVNKKLETNYPGENFIVSSDFKIFIEAVELREMMKDPDYSEEKAEKKLQGIIKLKKEMT
ncbi:YhcN/YlaJ family sporulation lipoprotein [Bacillus sp. REN3]|uniref:YhcN/YlaJ family sporulation lipoprotein n=1 Tax=Bacillus sp. REN3 TaxID=2802440 RepID=UPI001AEDBD6E|nr:YhcN/YlaJ family sporulation lipoprotein [Bacillus sp. REN3]